MSGDTLPAADPGLANADERRAAARRILDGHWQPEGYTVPNGHVYPHQWLWDSCFHAIVWAHLGEAERAVAELTNVFARQADDGFVPHMTYWRAPDLHADFWGRRGASSITQPPMYGHAIASLTRLGIEVDRELVERARAGLAFLRARRDRDGRVVIVHPWESGCDDSPRWDAWCPAGGWDPVRWKAHKGDLVASLVLDPITGSPIGNPRFEVAAAGFEALVAFNEAELAPLDPPAPTLHDDRPFAPPDVVADAPTPARTLEALLGVLVADPARDRAWLDDTFAAILDPTAFGGECGPAQVHRAEPAFEPARYWRGGAWPQLTYLLWVAADRLGRTADAATLASCLVRGATRSGFAEHWDPDTGAPGGAVPQTWTTLAAIVAP